MIMRFAGWGGQSCPSSWACAGCPKHSAKRPRGHCRSLPRRGQQTRRPWWASRESGGVRGGSHPSPFERRD